MQTQSAGDPTAVIGRRIGAYVIDTIILLVIVAVAFFALAESDPTAFDEDQSAAIERAFGGGDFDSDAEGRWDFGEAVGGFIAFDEDDFDVTFRIVEGGSFWAVNAIGLAASLGLLVLMQGSTGRTPGKALVGIRTVGPDGNPPGIGKAIVRWLLLFVDSFCLLPGLITSLTSKGHRRIGDMAAGTYVIRADAAGRPVAIGGAAFSTPQSAVAYGAPSADAQWDPARQAWIRWDGTAWTQHDPTAPGGWRPIS